LPTRAESDAAPSAGRTRQPRHGRAARRTDRRGTSGGGSRRASRPRPVCRQGVGRARTAPAMRGGDQVRSATTPGSPRVVSDRWDAGCKPPWRRCWTSGTAGSTWRRIGSMASRSPWTPRSPAARLCRRRPCASLGKASSSGCSTSRDECPSCSSRPERLAGNSHFPIWRACLVLAHCEAGHYDDAASRLIAMVDGAPAEATGVLATAGRLASDSPPNKARIWLDQALALKYDRGEMNRAVTALAERAHRAAQRLGMRSLERDVVTLLDLGRDWTILTVGGNAETSRGIARR
jgi:hypothetical protein